MLDWWASWLSRFSMIDMIIMVFAIAGAAKGALEIWDYLYNKAKGYFLKDTQTSSNFDSIAQQLHDLTSLQNGMENKLNEQLGSISVTINQIQEEMETMKKRMQDDTRAYIIDKYRRFVCEKKSIDEVSLEDIERHYMYYTAQKGDQYISNLMTKIRALPVEIPDVAKEAE